MSYRLSALRFKSIEEIRALEEAIRLSDKIFEVDTTGIEPLHTLVDEVISLTKIYCTSLTKIIYWLNFASLILM